MSNDKNYKGRQFFDSVILVGDCRVGKTSYLQYVIHEKFNGNQNNPPTIGVQYAPTTVKVRGQNVKINIWDTSGAEKYKSITSSYYRKCQGAIIMFDLTNEQSFQNLQGWLRQIQKRSNHKMVKIVIGNKLDLVQSGQKERKVSEKDLLEFCVRHSLTFKYASALTGTNVIESFNDIVQKIYDEYQVNNTIQQMGSISWDNNNPDLSFLPDKKVPIQPSQDSSSCPKCC